MKKRLLSIVMLIVFAAVVFAGCAQPAPAQSSPATSETPSASVAPSESAAPSPSPSESKAPTMIDTIKAKGQLILGTEAQYAPYEYHKVTDGKDEIKGMDIDIAKEIAKELGVELVIKDLPFDSLLTALTGNKIDLIIAGMEPREDRKKSVDFSDIYYNAEQGILVRAEDESKYTTIESLAGKKVGAQLGSTQESILKSQLKDSKPVVMEKVPDLVLSLSTKKVDGVICEAPVASNYVKNYPNLKLSQIKVVSETPGSAIAVNKGNPEFLALINSVIKKLNDAGKIAEFFAAADEDSSVK